LTFSDFPLFIQIHLGGLSQPSLSCSLEDAMIYGCFMVTVVDLIYAQIIKVSGNKPHLGLLCAASCELDFNPSGSTSAW